MWWTLAANPSLMHFGEVIVFRNLRPRQDKQVDKNIFKEWLVMVYIANSEV